MLDLPITIDELQEVALDSTNYKTPGPDGLPNLIYREYGEIMLPELLQVLNEAMEKEKLPVSMTEVTIIIPKEGKDPLQPTSYRPIPLLCADIKLLAKILASRLSKIIHAIVHPDQCGFIPVRSTSLNIRRLFLNSQIPVEEMESGVILFLDAVKAFDSVEWHYLWSALSAF